jgi:effector-binding domain-containing protein
MKVLKWLVVTVVVLVGAAFAYGLTLPNTTHLARSATIAAPACTVYAQLDNYRNFNKWSPWLQYDPDMQPVIEGPAYGVGARQSWTSVEVGNGAQEIIEAKPCSTLKSKLVFADFADNRYLATFQLTPQGEATQIEWVFDGEFGGSVVNQVMSRYFSAMVEKMLVADYDRGLTNLKQLTEALPKADFSALQVEQVDMKPFTVAAFSGHSSTDPGDIGKAYAESYARIMGFLKANGLNEAGPPIAVTRRWDETGKVFDFDAGIPVDRSEVAAAEGEVRLMQTYGGKTLKVTHTGPYESLARTYDMLKAYVAAYGYDKSADEWEEYVSDPGKTPAAELVTVIYYPVK